MTQPGDGELYRFMGRLEKQLDQIAAVNSQNSNTIVAHGVRLDNVEGDVKEIKDQRSVASSQSVSWRQMILIATLTLLGTGLVSWIVNLLSAHH